MRFLAILAVWQNQFFQKSWQSRLTSGIRSFLIFAGRFLTFFIKILKKSQNLPPNHHNFPKNENSSNPMLQLEQKVTRLLVSSIWAWEFFFCDLNFEYLRPIFRWSFGRKCANSLGMLIEFWQVSTIWKILEFSIFVLFRKENVVKKRFQKLLWKKNVLNEFSRFVSMNFKKPFQFPSKSIKIIVLFFEFPTCVVAQFSMFVMSVPTPRPT